MSMLSLPRAVARGTIVQLLRHRWSRALLVRQMAKGRVRYLPRFISHPIFLHVANYTREHPEFFTEIEKTFHAGSDAELQAAFWNSDFGYWFMEESDINFGKKPFYTYLREAIPERGATGLLDIGCGYGCLCRWAKEHFPQARVAGLDISPNVLAVARDRTAQAGLDVQYALGAGDTTLAQFGPKSYDVVVCTDSFQYMEHGRDVLRQMAAVATGMVFVISPRGSLSVEEYERLDRPIQAHDYDRTWVHPLVAYARELNLPVYRRGPTSANCYFLDIRFDSPTDRPATGA